MPCVGRVLPRRRGVPVPHGAGPAPPVPRGAAVHGLHPDGTAADPAARPGARGPAVPAHRRRAHDRPRREVAAGVDVGGGGMCVFCVFLRLPP